MGEIFIPEKTFEKIIINNISDNFLKLLKDNFTILEVKKFESVYCTGKYIKVPNINQDILSLLNGEFGETYFVDYDFFKNDFVISGTIILKPEQITQNILEISEQFAKITKDLSSSQLLTYSKKQGIQNKIEKTFFTISGILFLLYSLRDKSIENYKELGEYNGNIEFEAQAELIGESAKTKQIELSAQITKFEAQSELFFQTIQKIFL